MKSTKSLVCPEHLLNFDASKYTLLSAVWEYLKEPYFKDARKLVYQKWQEKLLSTNILGVFKLATTNIQGSLYEHFSVKTNHPETKLDIFLNGIYCIERLKERCLEMQDAKDAIDRIPGGYNIFEDIEENTTLLEFDVPKAFSQLRKVFLEYIAKARPILDGLAWQIFLSGHFKITQNKVPSQYTNFQSFSEDLLKRIREELDHERIPNIIVNCSFDRLFISSQMEHFVDSICCYSDSNKYSEQLGKLLLEMHNIVLMFDTILYNPTEYLKLLKKGKAFTPVQDEQRKKAKSAAIRMKKELLEKGMSAIKANTIVQSELEKVSEFKEIFKDKKGEPWSTENWKKFLQPHKIGTAR